MQLIDDLIARAAAADNAAGQLAMDQASVLARQKAYDNLQHLFDQAAADGKLSEDEVANLMRSFREAGLDTSALEEIARQFGEMDHTDAGGVDVGADLRTKIAEQLQTAKIEAGEDPLFEFKAQKAMAQYNQSFDLAARVSKSEHDMYMVAIKNLVA